MRAAQALEETDWSAQSTNVPWLPFLRADLARREDRVWSDSALDERLAIGDKPYSAWLYFQATARQASRPERDAVDRLQRAIMLLHHESGGIKGNACNLLAAMLSWQSRHYQQTQGGGPRRSLELSSFWQLPTNFGSITGRRSQHFRRHLTWPRLRVC